MTETLDRRHFLRVGAATAGLACAPNLFGADDKKDDPFGGFLLGMQSYTFRDFNVEQALKKTKEVGLRSVEFYPGQKGQVSPGSSPEQINAMLKLCKEYEVTPRAWGVVSFNKNDAANEKIFSFAASMGVASLSADPDPDSFDSLDKMCEKYKIAIAIHPHGPQGGTKAHRWSSAETIMKAVKDHNPLIGSCLDTGHLLRMAQLGVILDPAKEILIMGPRNFGIHLKDHDNKTKRDVVFGKGTLDVVSVLKALREVKFKYLISIEYEHNPANNIDDVKACIDVFKESVKKLS